MRGRPRYGAQRAGSYSDRTGRGSAASSPERAGAGARGKQWTKTPAPLEFSTDGPSALEQRGAENSCRGGLMHGENSESKRTNGRRRPRLLVADDHEIVRCGVRKVVEDHGCEVCAEAADGRQAVQLARRLKPDIVVIDTAMPELNGIEATRQICDEAPLCKVIVLTHHDAERVVRDALLAGARGYVLKSDSAAALTRAIDAVSDDTIYLSRQVETVVLAGYLRGEASSSAAHANGARECLSPREREIVQLLAEGKSNKEVGTALCISTRTVETHRSNVMRKLELHSLSELIHFAIRNEIVQA